MNGRMISCVSSTQTFFRSKPCVRSGIVENTTRRKSSRRLFTFHFFLCPHLKMQYLPEEVLVNVFKHLPQKDLLSTSLVCKSFSALIDSYDLIETLSFNSHCDESFQPKRRYSKLKVAVYKSAIHQIVLDNVGHCIGSLKIAVRNLSLKDIAAILRSTSNVKNLEFYYVRLLDDNPPAEGAINLPILDNVSLTFAESDPMIFSILTRCSMVKIDLRFFGDVPYSQFDHFVTMMNNQEKLTSFSVSGVYEANLFLIPMVNQKYRLKEFSIKNCDIEEWEFLDNYLRDHVDALELLSVHDLNWTSANIVSQCKNLKKFSCHQDEVLEINAPLFSIEELSLKARQPALLEKFPNVKKINILQSSPGTFQAMSRSMTQLEELQVKFGGLIGLEAPTLKKLVLQSLDSDVDIDPNFFVTHHKIEELIFYHIFNINDDLLEAIAINLKNLKVLKIIGDNKMTSRAFKIITDNCKQLKVFEMKFWDQKFQKDDWVSLHEIPGLKIFMGDATSKTFFKEW